MWKIDNCLSRYPNCPLCGSLRRTRPDLPPAETGFYTNTLLESWDIDVASLLGRLEMWQCVDCATLWYDPWFDLDFASIAYTTAVGRHKYGWAAFRNWAVGNQRPYFFGRPLLFDLLQQATPNLTRYAEVNCPFGGLFFEFLDRSSPPFDKRLLQGWMSALVSVYQPADFNRDYGAPDMFAAVGPNLPQRRPSGVERTLLLEHSPMCWGRSCNIGGVNCVAVAQGPFVDRISTFEQSEVAGAKLDAIGFFNTLDHFPSPLSVLVRAMRLADVVILDLHKWAWMDAQHHFNIGTGLAAKLIERGAAVVDVSDYVTENGKHGDDRRYLFCSFVRDLSEIRARVVETGSGTSPN